MTPTIKPFAGAGGYTTFDNNILDHIMPICPPNVWKVVCVTLRQTVGRQNKKEDWLSISQYMKRTGIKGRSTMTKAISNALSMGVIVRKPYRNSYKYKLNRNYEMQIGTETGLAKSPETRLGASPETGHTKETITKQTNTKEKKGRKPPARKPKRDLDHPAIQAYRVNAHLHVKKTWRQRVIDSVGDDQADVKRWGELVDDWVGSGWNKSNVKGMLEKFQGKPRANGKPKGNLSTFEQNQKNFEKYRQEEASG